VSRTAALVASLTSYFFDEMNCSWIPDILRLLNLCSGYSTAQTLEALHSGEVYNRSIELGSYHSAWRPFPSMQSFTPLSQVFNVVEPPLGMPIDISDMPRRSTCT
jgi:hypothetical protein